MRSCLEVISFGGYRSLSDLSDLGAHDLSTLGALLRGFLSSQGFEIAPLYHPNLKSRPDEAQLRFTQALSGSSFGIRLASNCLAAKKDSDHV